MKIYGFEVIIHCDNYTPRPSPVWDKYNQAKKDMWAEGEYISHHVEFGSSPIRDKKALDRYCAIIKSYDLNFTVHPITR
jgi:hypothetical protein